MNKKLLITFSFLLLAVTSAVYFPALNIPFLYDDADVILRPQAFDRPEYIKDVFTRKYYERFGERTYRPVATLSIFADRALWGTSSRAFHIHNIILHSLAGIAVLLLLSRIGISPLWSFFGGLIFTLHPVRTEAVALASNREELLCGLFFFLAYYFYLGRSARSGILAVVSMVVAVLSKEMAAALPLVLIAHEIYYADRNVPILKNISGAVRKAVPYLLVAALPLVFKFTALGNAEGAADAPGATLWESVIIMSGVFLKYCRLALLPVHQCADYVVAAAGGAIAPLGLLIFIALAIYLRKFGRTGGFTLSFFLLSLLPVSNIIPFGETMAERYLYIPMFALSLGAATLMDRWTIKRIKLIPAAALLVFYAMLTFNRLGVWQSDYRLWGDTTVCARESAEAWLNFGNANLRNGNPEKALEMYSRVPGCRTKYEKAKLYYNTGLSLESLGRTGKALDAFLATIDEDTGFVEAYYHAGKLTASYGDVEKGLTFLERAIGAEPDAALSYYVAANYVMRYYKDREHLEIASEWLEEAVRLDQASGLYRGALGQAYFRGGKINEAEATLLESIRKEPGLVPSYLMLMDIYRATGREDRAARIEQELRLYKSKEKPNDDG